MSVAVEIPGGLRNYCHASGDINVSATTVAAALVELKSAHPSLYTSVCDETGTVRPHINLFVNSSWVPARESHGLDTALRAGDVLTIWPAVSGG